MDKTTARTLAKARGAKTEAIDPACDHFTFPTEKAVLAFRYAIPYATLFYGEKGPGAHVLGVFWNELRGADPGESSTLEAVEAAFLAMGRAGANTIPHPMRAAWEACRAVLKDAGRLA